VWTTILTEPMTEPPDDRWRRQQRTPPPRAKGRQRWRRRSYGYVSEHSVLELEADAGVWQSLWRCGVDQHLSWWGQLGNAGCRYQMGHAGRGDQRSICPTGGSGSWLEGRGWPLPSATLAPTRAMAFSASVLGLDRDRSEIVVLSASGARHATRPRSPTVAISKISIVIVTGGEGRKTGLFEHVSPSFETIMDLPA